MRVQLVAILLFLLASLLSAPTARAHWEHIDSARVEARWAGEQLDFAIGRLESAAKAKTAFWAHHHAGAARTWLKNFRVRGRTAHNYVIEASLFDGGGKVDVVYDTGAAIAHTRASEALRDATAAWKARSRPDTRRLARAALKSARAARDQWQVFVESLARAAHAQLLDEVALRDTDDRVQRGSVRVFEDVGAGEQTEIRLAGSIGSCTNVFLAENATEPYGVMLWLGFTCDNLSVRFGVRGAFAYDMSGRPVSLDYVIVRIDRRPAAEEPMSRGRVLQTSDAILPRVG